MPQFVDQQLLEICRLADDAMSRLIEKAARHVIAERHHDDTMDGFFEPRDYLSDWAAEYMGYGHLRQAAGSIDDTQHTRERFDAAVTDRVATIDRAPPPDRDANL